MVEKIRFRWNFDCPGNVAVTGWKSEVRNVLQYIGKMCDVCDDKLVFDPFSFRYVNLESTFSWCGYYNAKTRFCSLICIADS